MNIGVVNLCPFAGRRHCFLRKSSDSLILAIASVQLDLTTAAFAPAILQKLRD